MCRSATRCTRAPRRAERTGLAQGGLDRPRFGAPGCSRWACSATKLGASLAEKYFPPGMIPRKRRPGHRGASGGGSRATNSHMFPPTRTPGAIQPAHGDPLGQTIGGTAQATPLARHSQGGRRHQCVLLHGLDAAAVQARAGLLQRLDDQRLRHVLKVGFAGWLPPGGHIEPQRAGNRVRVVCSIDAWQCVERQRRAQADQLEHIALRQANPPHEPLAAPLRQLRAPPLLRLLSGLEGLAALQPVGCQAALDTARAWSVARLRTNFPWFAPCRPAGPFREKHSFERW
jgi:hypothetical protein